LSIFWRIWQDIVAESKESDSQICNSIDDISHEGDMNVVHTSEHVNDDIQIVEYQKEMREEVVPVISVSDIPSSNWWDAPRTSIALNEFEKKPEDESVKMPLMLHGLSCNKNISMYIEANSTEPRTYSEAISGHERKYWQEAIAKEFDNLKKLDVIRLAITPPNLALRKLKTKYVFKRK
jgi:hypothetical protein